MSPESESQALSQEDLYRLLVEGVRDYAIFMLDPDGIVVTWNAGAERIKGYAAEDIIGQSFSRFYPEEAVRSGCPAHALAVAAAEGRFEDEGWRVRKDGSRFWANAVLTALRDGAGKLRGFAKVTRDLTRRREAEEQARQLGRAQAARAEAEAASRRKDEFLAVLGHELRNPLAPLHNCLQILNLAEANDPDTREAGEIMARQVRLLTRLVDDLLDLSRVSRGLVRLRKERVDLRTVVAGAVETASVAIEERGHALTMCLPPAPVWLEADPLRLGQVVVNLLTNAAKYTPAGGRIEVEARRTELLAEVRVRDNGIGIRPEDLPRIFEMFAHGGRVESRVHEGLGIGLTLVKSLVEQHGGTVEAHSNGPGGGSEFLVRLPALCGEVSASA